MVFPEPRHSALDIYIYAILNLFESSTASLTLFLFLTFFFTLSFSMDPSSHDFSSQFGANITMEFPKGYPAKALSVVSYRSSHIVPKEVIENIVSCVKTTASEAVEVYGSEECGLQCCAAALDCWNEWIEESRILESQTKDLASEIQQDIQNDDDINWISSENLLVDRKSTFQAHICVVD